MKTFFLFLALALLCPSLVLGQVLIDGVTSTRYPDLRTGRSYGFQQGFIDTTGQAVLIKADTSGNLPIASNNVGNITAYLTVDTSGTPGSVGGQWNGVTPNIVIQGQVADSASLWATPITELANGNFARNDTLFDSTDVASAIAIGRVAKDVSDNIEVGKWFRSIITMVGALPDSGRFEYKLNFVVQ